MTLSTTTNHGSVFTIVYTMHYKLRTLLLCSTSNNMLTCSKPYGPRILKSVCSVGSEFQPIIGYRSQRSIAIVCHVINATTFVCADIVKKSVFLT